jgi:cyclophilin family peptidyl-prolyl cis-trans isomerase
MLALVLGGPVAFAGATSKDNESGRKPTLKPRVRMETSLGSVVFELSGDLAPGTVQNFLQYARDGYYEGTIFHRVIKAFMIQGGGFTPDLKEKSDGLRDPIKNEWRNGLKNKRGTLAMARLGNQPDSAQASFYINLTDTDYFDKPMDGAGYCVFGRVVEGQSTVEKIGNVETKPYGAWHPTQPVLPVEAVLIKSVEILDPVDDERMKELAGDFGQVIDRAIKAEKDVEQAAVQEIADRVARYEKDYDKQMTKTASGLRFLDMEVGGGPSPRLQDVVVVHYRGIKADGTEFDNSRLNPDLKGQPFDSLLHELIDGWAEGMQSMKTGGRRILVIPPALGHGARGHPKVGQNQTLFYEIELLRVIPIEPVKQSQAQPDSSVPKSPSR